MIQELSELYIDLTEPQYINVIMSQNKISILIISRWFELQSESERLDYLAEGLQVVYPYLTETYTIHFTALTPMEAKQRIKMAS